MKRFLALIFMTSFMIASVFMMRVQIVKADEGVSYDSNMETKNYKTDIVVGKDGSYTVTETWKVDFKKPRHGIYRYIPYKGNIYSYDQDGSVKKFLYFADFELLSNDSGTELEESSEDGSVILRFGEEDRNVRSGIYRFSYRLVPKYQGDTYNCIYYNIFPTQWQNSIPKGSSFTIHFPKETNFNKIQFYYGRYGNSKNAGDILTLKRDEKNRVITGTLKRDLKFYSGLTCYGEMEEGYFNQNHEIETHRIILIFTFLIFSLGEMKK